MAPLETIVAKFTKSCTEYEEGFEQRVSKLEKNGRNYARDIAERQDDIEGDIERRLVKLEKRKRRGVRNLVADQANDGLGDENLGERSEGNNSDNDVSDGSGEE